MAINNFKNLEHSMQKKKEKEKRKQEQKNKGIKSYRVLAGFSSHGTSFRLGLISWSRVGNLARGVAWGVLGVSYTFCRPRT